MAFDINQFTADIMDRRVLRPNLFRVRIFPPPALALPDGNGIIQDLELWGEASEIPMIQLGAHQMPRWGYGSVEKRPFMPQYREWQVMFRVDADGQIWRYFKEWNKLIVNNDAPSDGTGTARYEIAYKDDYMVDMNVAVFDELGNDAIDVTLIEAYPYAVESIKLDWADNNAYARLGVVFTFTDWIESPRTIAQ